MLEPGALGNPSRAASHLEHTGEMVRLAGIGHIDHAAGAIAIGSGTEAVANRRQIGGGVVEAAIALAHDQRQRLAVLAAHPLQEHALGAVVGDEQASGIEVGHDSRQVGVVEGFAALAEADVEAVVDLLELAPALIAEQAPGLERHRIAALQLHHLLAGGGLKGVVVVEAGLGLAVEGHQIAEIHRIGGGERLGGHLLEVGDQHAELGAPVADVVEAQHRMAAELQHPGQGVADDRGAQMPHVHLLGDVGAGEIHNHRRRGLDARLGCLRHAGHAKTGVRESGHHLRRQALRPEGEVDETGAGDLRLQAQLCKSWIRLQLGHDRRGDRPRRLAEGLGQGQGAVGLKVAEFRLAGGGQLRIQGGAGRLSCGRRLGEGPLHRRAQLGLQGLGDAKHGVQGPQRRQHTPRSSLPAAQAAAAVSPSSFSIPSSTTSATSWMR